MANGFTARNKVIDPELFLAGRERPPPEGEIFGRQPGDAERLFPRYTHACAASTGEVMINGKVLKLWTFSQLEALKGSVLRERAQVIRDFVGEANCPPLPSTQPADLTRWILHMQEQLTHESPKEGRSGGYGTGHHIPPAFAQDTKDRPIVAHRPVPSVITEDPRKVLDAKRDHFRDLKHHLNEFQEDGVNGESRRHLYPKQNIVSPGIYEDPQDQNRGGRKYLACHDNLKEQKEELEEMHRPGWKPSNAAIRPMQRTAPAFEDGAAGGRQRLVREGHLDSFGVVGEQNVEVPIGGERRRRNGHAGEDHFVNVGTAASRPEESPPSRAADSRKYINVFGAPITQRETQNAYRST